MREPRRGGGGKNKKERSKRRQEKREGRGEGRGEGGGEKREREKGPSSHEHAIWYRHSPSSVPSTLCSYAYQSMLCSYAPSVPNLLCSYARKGYQPTSRD
eukprot:1508748-Rhodomonas_salina.1